MIDPSTAAGHQQAGTRAVLEPVVKTAGHVPVTREYLDDVRAWQRWVKTHVLDEFVRLLRPGRGPR